MKMETKKIGSLNCLSIPSSQRSENNPCVVLLHGYGADARDLASLGAELSLGSNVDWVFPDAPLSLAISPEISGRAWFEIDIKALELAMSQGATRDMTQLRPKGMDQARDMVISMLKKLREKHSQIILGGFSQGAMLATEVALFQKVKPLALAVLSGTLVDQSHWEPMVEKSSHFPIFQSHGQNDPVLGYQYAEHLHQLFKKAKFPCEFHGFRGGHEISVEVLFKLQTFLKKHLTQP